jgi:hypothetical protein
MFDKLEADIVVLQEIKMQRSDLTDDMIDVPGWDCFFCLASDKKGLFATCAPFPLRHACWWDSGDLALTGDVTVRLFGRRHLHTHRQMLPHTG